MLGIKHGHLDITRYVAPDQAQFEPEYFLTLTEGGPPLFNLIGQCFQDVSLTKWNKVVRKRCLNNNYLAKASFKKQWERPPQYSSYNYSRLHCLITLAQIAEGKKIIEPAEVSIEDFFLKCISWIKNTLVFMMTKFGSVLSVISTYLKLHIGLRSFLWIAAAEWMTACSTSNNSNN